MSAGKVRYSVQKSASARCIEGAALEGFGFPGFVIGNGAGNALIKTSRVNGGFKLNVARLQIMLVKPQVQLFPLLGRQSVNRAFNLLQVHDGPFSL
jgi:hypothetical protein